MATLYVHCGLHKTGTTALQRVLASHDENLAGGGFHVPKAGRFGPATGHHNLAWELTRDRRYDPRRGGLAALRTELLEVAGDVIVSSEDFESLLHRPAALAPLVKLAQDTGRTVTWVVYLREQVAYLGALYLQCLKAGFGEEYSSFVHEVLSRRAIQRWEWTFQFDYGGVLERLSALETCGVLVRSYHELVGGSTVSDFFSALNIPLDLAPSDALSLRTHERNALNVSLQSFFRNRVQRDLSPVEVAVADAMAAVVRAEATPGWAETRLREAFAPSNEQVSRRFGIAPFPAAAPAPDAADMAKLFSFETQVHLAAVARLAGRAKGDQIPPEARERIEAWSAWLRAS